MDGHKHHLYLLEPHSNTSKIWPTIRIIITASSIA